MGIPFLKDANTYRSLELRERDGAGEGRHAEKSNRITPQFSKQFQ
jgi:hypothetical protein